MKEDEIKKSVGQTLDFIKGKCPKTEDQIKVCLGLFSTVAVACKTFLGKEGQEAFVELSDHIITSVFKKEK